MKTCQAPLTGTIISIETIAMQFHKIIKQPGDIITRFGPFGMSSQIYTIPGIHMCIRRLAYFFYLFYNRLFLQDILAF